MTYTLKLASAATAAAIGSALAGPAPLDVSSVSEPVHVGDWANSLKTFGKFHSDSSSPYIQELKFFGRAQWQYAAIDGSDVNGDSFDSDFTEFRRVRVGAQIKFLNNFTLKGNINLVDDDATSGGSESFGYQSFDQLKLTYKTKNFAGFDTFAASYGRHKVALGHEGHESSKKIKTVERSALANRLTTSARYTGLTLSAEKGDWSGKFGVFSTADSGDDLGGWNAGQALYLTSTHKALGGEVVFDAFWSIDEDDDELSTNRWAASASYTTDINNWNYAATVAYGEDLDGDNFYGVVLSPSTYIIKDKLEFVARYQFQGSSEDDGIRTNSRYFRADQDADVNGGFGDSHHSIYAGLNYYFVGHQSKILVGVEYENLDTPLGNTDATTVSAAYRLFF